LQQHLLVFILAGVFHYRAHSRKKRPGVGMRRAFGCVEGDWFLFEGEGEVEDQVAYGDAQGEFVGFGVADEPEFAGGFLAWGEIGGFESHGAD